MPLREASIIAQKPLTGGYFLLRLKTPALAESARPGQFVHLRIPSLEPTALRRPFSIYRAERGELALLYKRVGRGTDALATMPAGSVVSLMGPLGNGFPAADTGHLPILIGGGYGVAPLVFLASRLPRKGVVLLGGRRAEDVRCTSDFEALGWLVEVATEDGSRGAKGLVTALLDRHLARADAQPELFACGPDGMLRAVGTRAIAADCRAWLSLDHHMVCGIGACLACVQKLRAPDGNTRIARVCKDGPVFEAREIVWEDPA
jgi:dihydroorotate dehydrogenase electron transfer subunit